MIIKFKKSELMASLNKLSSIGNSKKQHPVLRNILFQVDEKIKLTVNDSNTVIELCVPGEIVEPGEYTIPCQQLIQIVSSMKNEINIKVDENTGDVFIEENKVKFKIKGIKASEFPLTPTVEGQAIELAGDDIISGFLKTMQYTSLIDNQVISGVNVKICEDKIKFIGIDGNRMAIYYFPMVGDKFECTFPGALINEVVKIIQSDIIKITQGNSLIKIEFIDGLIVSGMLNGTFPSVENFIPESYKNIIKINKKELMESIKKLHLINDKEEYCCAKLYFSRNQLNISYISKEGAEFNEILDCEYTGDIKININSKYLLTALSGLDNNVAKIMINEPNSIISIQEDNYKIAIMPIIKG